MERNRCHYRVIHLLLIWLSMGNCSLKLPVSIESHWSQEFLSQTETSVLGEKLRARVWTKFCPMPPNTWNNLFYGFALVRTHHSHISKQMVNIEYSKIHLLANPNDPPRGRYQAVPRRVYLPYKGLTPTIRPCCQGSCQTSRETCPIWNILGLHLQDSQSCINHRRRDSIAVT